MPVGARFDDKANNAASLLPCHKSMLNHMENIFHKFLLNGEIFLFMHMHDMNRHLSHKIVFLELQIGFSSKININHEIKKLFVTCA